MNRSTSNAKIHSAATFNRLAESQPLAVRDACHAGWIAQVVPDICSARPRSLLDVGCGAGELLDRTSSCGASLAGIDISEGMLAVARKRLGARADLRLGDAEALPWPDGEFDAVVCMASFHHYPDPRAALREMRRVLCVDGRAYLAEIRIPALLRPLLNNALPLLRTGDVRMYSEREVMDLAVASGFSVLSARQLSGNGFLVTLVGAESADGTGKDAK